MNRLLVFNAAVGGFFAGIGLLSLPYHLKTEVGSMFVTSSVLAFVAGCVVVALCVARCK